MSIIKSTIGTVSSPRIHGDNNPSSPPKTLVRKRDIHRPHDLPKRNSADRAGHLRQRLGASEAEQVRLACRGDYRCFRGENGVIVHGAEVVFGVTASERTTRFNRSRPLSLNSKEHAHPNEAATAGEGLRGNEFVGKYLRATSSWRPRSGHLDSVTRPLSHLLPRDRDLFRRIWMNNRFEPRERSKQYASELSRV